MRNKPVASIISIYIIANPFSYFNSRNLSPSAQSNWAWSLKVFVWLKWPLPK